MNEERVNVKAKRNKWWTCSSTLKI